MKVLEVVPKDIYITIELRLEEIQHLAKALEMSRVDFNGKDAYERTAVEKLGEFSNLLAEIVENVDGP